MPSSDSSSSSEDYRKKRSKHKKDRKKSKKEKKSKKKKSKRSRRDSSSSSDSERSRSPVRPAHTHTIPMPPPRPPPTEASNDEASFGPALPPHLMKKNEEEEVRPVLGPVLPAGFVPSYSFKVDEEVSDKEEQDMDTIGPLPAGDDFSTMTTAQIELEQRALELKLASLDNTAGTSAGNENVREEWMLELPEVGANKGSLTNLKRCFQSKEGPDFSDRSSWTKTPNDAKHPKVGSSKSKESIQAEAEKRFERQRDEEQEKMAKKHKKKHKRDESLVDIHIKKMKKEKEAKAKEGKAERRPFSRDVDLKPNIIDSSRTKTIINAAKILNTKFSTGKAKYL